MLRLVVEVPASAAAAGMAPRIVRFWLDGSPPRNLKRDCFLIEALVGQSLRAV